MACMTIVSHPLQRPAAGPSTRARVLCRAVAKIAPPPNSPSDMLAELPLTCVLLALASTATCVQRHIEERNS